MDTWVVVANLSVAGATLVLAIIAFSSLLASAKRNKKTDEWNRRAERTRVMPWIDLEILEFKLSGKGKRKWVSEIRIKITNVGLGPVTNFRLLANYERMDYDIFRNGSSYYQKAIAVGESVELQLKGSKPKDPLSEIQDGYAEVSIDASGAMWSVVHTLFYLFFSPERRGILREYEHIDDSDEAMDYAP